MKMFFLLTSRPGRIIQNLIVVLAVLSGNTVRALSSSAHNPVDVRFITFNIDFNNNNAENKADVNLAAPNADIMMFQEAKYRVIDNYLGNAWTVYQFVGDEAKQGSALAWRNSLVTQVLGTGLLVGVKPKPGDGLLTRYIAWADLKLTNNQVIRVMALHIPPARNADLQEPMVDKLAAFANDTPYPVVAGADWNFRIANDPYNIKTKAGLKTRGVGTGIDGFAYSESAVAFTSITKMASLNVASDHDPVQMITKVYNISSPVNDWALYD